MPSHLVALQVFTLFCGTAAAWVAGGKIGHAMSVQVLRREESTANFLHLLGLAPACCFALSLVSEWLGAGSGIVFAFAYGFSLGVLGAHVAAKKFGARLVLASGSGWLSGALVSIGCLALAMLTCDSNLYQQVMKGMGFLLLVQLLHMVLYAGLIVGRRQSQSEQSDPNRVTPEEEQQALALTARLKSACDDWTEKGCERRWEVEGNIQTLTDELAVLRQYRDADSGEPVDTATAASYALIMNAHINGLASRRIPALEAERARVNAEIAPLFDALCQVHAEATAYPKKDCSRSDAMMELRMQLCTSGVLIDLEEKQS